MIVNHLSSYTNTEVVAFLVKKKAWGSTPAYIWQTQMPLFIVPKRSCDGLMYTYHHGQVMMEGYQNNEFCCLIPSPPSSFLLLALSKKRQGESLVFFLTWAWHSWKTFQNKHAMIHRLSTDYMTTVSVHEKWSGESSEILKAYYQICGNLGPMTLRDC